MKQNNSQLVFAVMLSIVIFESTIFILLLAHYKNIQQQLYETLETRKKYLELMEEIEFRIKKKILFAE
jgi:hypothetical protein